MVNESMFMGQLASATCANLVIVFLLRVWATWVADRHASPWWRKAAWLPWLGFALGTIGVAVSGVMLIRVFGAIATTEPSQKSAELAKGISLAMRVGAPLLFLGWGMQVTAIITCIVGTLRRRSRPLE